MNTIEFKRATIRFSETFSLVDISWQIEPGNVWAIIGGNGSGKSALACAVAGMGKITTGTIEGLPLNIGMVSLAAQADLIERERDRDDSDITDKIYEGTSVAEMLDEVSTDPELLVHLVELFSLAPLMQRAFRKLSTGETRKLLITRALTCRPEMLILDDPFEGLDAETVPLVRDILRRKTEETAMVLVFNRLHEIPDFVTHIAYLENGSIKLDIETAHPGAMEDLSQLLHLEKADLEIPVAGENKAPALDDTNPLVRIRNAGIRYGDNIVFENLDWCIEPHHHWQLTGPNGSGKTCLLNLITGDHPQCYNNDIFVFGHKRGSGESIWEIKQHIGYVSTALQWQHRVSISLVNVIISGFYDSIGLYNNASDNELQIAMQWLQLIGLSDQPDRPFNQLSYGDQRLLLIARAMVKHPPLLILDEPCLGLDDINRQMVLLLIEKICAGSETTVLYVSHHAQDKIEGIERFLRLGQAQNSRSAKSGIK